MNYVFKRVLTFFVIFVLLSFLKGCEVHAATYNPRYATINGNYLYQDSAIKSANKINYNTSSGGYTRNNYCISTSYESNNTNGEETFAHYAEISICSTGYNGFNLSSGTGYAALDGSLDYTSEKCTVQGYEGRLLKVYIHLLDWTTPSGGADFSWSCFQLQHTNLYGYTVLNQLTDIQLTTDSNYTTDKNNLTIILQQQQLNTNITNFSNQAHTDSQNTQNAINSASSQAHQDFQDTQNAINSQTNTITDSSIPTDTNTKVSNIMSHATSQNANVSDLVNFIPNLLQQIINGFNTSCSGGYSLGTLFGTELIIPCINPVDYLGSFLWGVIDSILCLCYLIPLCKFLVNKYNDLTSLKNLRWE